MASQLETVEERLKSFQAQLRTEFGILDRIVYKNKNQHRRSSYFQYLLKVRRDLRLLQSANLEEIVNSCFLVIHGKRPKQKVQLLESLKRKRCDAGKHNFLERLLGIAHLLSQMVEPLLKAAMEISTLLAQSFFMAFSLTVLALLARIRVLVQQILLDVVFTFNSVSSLSQKEQAIKIKDSGLEVFREYYPIKDEPLISLECVWETDKYVLVEKMNKDVEAKTVGKDIGEDAAIGASAIQYQSVEILLGDNENGEMDSKSAPEGPPNDRKSDVSSPIGPLPQSNDKNLMKEGSPTKGCTSIMAPEASLLMATRSPSHSSIGSLPQSNEKKLMKEGSPSKGSTCSMSLEGSFLMATSSAPHLSIGPLPESSEKKLMKEGLPTKGSTSSMAPEGSLLMATSSPPHSNPRKRKYESKEKVAFVSVKLPAPSKVQKENSSIGRTDQV